MFKHIDLFSGIGTWGLASREVWPDREMVGFCEIEEFPQAILRKHFPDVPIWDDVKKLSELSKTEICGMDDEIALISMSPPCQSISTAGKRLGNKDPRWLWPYGIKIIGNIRPRWFIAENPTGLLSIEGGLLFEQVCTQLEEEGYEIAAFNIPAASVEAPHQRYRVWLVGRRIDQNPIGIGRGGGSEDRPEIHERQESEVQAEGQGGAVAPDTESGQSGESETGDWRENTGRGSKEVGPDTYPKRLEGQGTELKAGRTRPDGEPRLAPRSAWSRDWREVAYETCWEDATKPGVHLLAHGITPYLSFFLGELNYASTYQNLSRQDLSSLWNQIQSSEIQWPTGRFGEIPSKDFLLGTLRWFQRNREVFNKHEPKKGEKVSEGEMRRMRDEISSARSSSEWEVLGEHSKKLSDIMPFMPQEIALEIMEVWHSVRLLQIKFPRAKVVNIGNGQFISPAKWRQEAIKACGNGIVGQVAVEIMKAIRETDNL